MLRLFFLVLMAFCAPLGAWAQSTGPYTLDKVVVEIPNADLVRARDQAIALGAAEGFSRLLRSLTTQQMWDKHPEIIEAADLNLMLEQFNVIDETTVGTTYTLTLSLHFNRERVRELLTRMEIPFSEVGAGPVLVLPLFDMPNGRMLWDEMNPWRMALAEAVNKVGLVHFILPLGDPREILMLTPEMAAYGASDMIMEIGRYYNARMIAVAHMRPTVVEGKSKLAVDMTWYGAYDLNPLSLEYDNSSEKDFTEIMAGVAEKSLQSLEEEWRKVYLLRFDDKGKTTVSLDKPSLKAIEDFRNQIANVSVVKSVRLDQASVKKASFSVEYFGTAERFLDMAKDSGITLVRQDDGWQVVSKGE